jgi:hypothetical protein
MKHLLLVALSLVLGMVNYSSGMQPQQDDRPCVNGSTAPVTCRSELGLGPSVNTILCSGACGYFFGVTRCVSSPDMVQIQGSTGVGLDSPRIPVQYDPKLPGRRAAEVGVTHCGIVSPCGCFDLDSDGQREACTVDTTKSGSPITIYWYNGLSDVVCPVASFEGGPGGQE